MFVRKTVPDSTKLRLIEGPKSKFPNMCLPEVIKCKYLYWELVF